MNLTVRRIAIVGVMLALILSLQSLHMFTFITGIIINSLFIFTLLYAGCFSASILAFLSPIGALITGILPAAMYPITCIIMFGNLFLILLYKFLIKSSYALKVIIPALVKSIFIGLIGYFLLKKFVTEEMAANVVKTVSLPFFVSQFFTSIVGIILGTEIMRKMKLVGFYDT